MNPVIKARLYGFGVLVLGFFLGFATGRGTTEKPAHANEIHGIAVDCYDAQGKLVADEFAQFGGVRTSCASGQTAKLRQPAH